jgi:putative inorganic carbon (HCO3(-)) transporter
VTRSTLAALGGAVVVVALVLTFGPVAVLAGTVALTGLFTILRFPLVGLYALVVLLPFNALVSQVAPSGIGTGYGLAKDAIVGALLIVALVNRRVRRVPPPVVFLVTLLVLLPNVSALFSPSLSQALYGWRNNYEPLLLLIIVPALVDVRQVRRLMLTIVSLAQISSLIAIATWQRGVQWLLDIGRLPVPEGERFPTSLFSAGSTAPRAFSPYVAPNEMAAAMLISLAVVWCTPRLRPSHRMLLTALPAVAIYLSQSRSGIFGAVILAAVLIARALRKTSRMLSAGFIAVGGLAIIVAATLYIGDALRQETDTSFGGHADSLQDAADRLLLHPLGMGLGMVGPRAAQFESSYQVESFWLLLALEAGPLVLLLFLALLGVLSSRGLRATTPAGFVAPAAICATLVSQLVLPTLQEGSVSFLLWLVVGLSIAAQSDETTNRPLGSATQSKARLRG